MTRGTGISGSLTEVFRAHARAGLALPADPDQLERALVQRHEEARALRPGLALPAEVFVRHVAERLPGEKAGAPVEEVLDALRLSDLYLACACANRVRSAAELLDRECLSKLPGLLRSQFNHVSDTLIEEACQLVRVKLLMGEPAGRPHLLTYTGEGALMSWARVIAVRTLGKLLRPAGPVQDDVIFEPEVPGDQDVERDAVRRDLLQKLRGAVRDAARSLPKDDRHLLKLYYKDRVSTARLASYYETSQPTMWRRLDRIREGLLAESKRLLRER